MQFRTENEILQEAIQQAQNNGLIAEDEKILERINNGELTNNQYVLDLATHAYIHAELERLISEVYNNSNVNQATGSALDTLGDLFDVKRYTAQPAMAEITVSTPALLEEDIIIPAGTKVILQEFYSTRGYHTLNEVTLLHGMESVQAVIECDEYGFGMNLPSGAVTGLVGFETLVVTNTEKGTNGRFIEEDEDYRERIKNWPATHKIGTKACIEEYLEHMEGVDTFILLPMYDGNVGSLKIIVDTLQSRLAEIRDEVYDNCMLFTDPKPVVERPTSVTIQNFTVNIYPGENILITENELKQLIINQSQIYISGGISRKGKNIKGMSIGQNFAPSQLERFLLDEITEIYNISINLDGVVICPDDSKLELGEVEVNII